ncbi:hypothetical protein BDW75DRAFT_244609 [Aspergillus navahoensis]
MPKYTESRDSIKDIWGERTPYKHQWPTRCDSHLVDTPDKWVQSACVLCSNGCGLDIGVKDGKVVGVRGRTADRVNKGRLGPKGLNGWVSINHPDRLTHPLIRRNGKLERASWDEAMSLIVKRAKDIQSRLTHHGIAFYTNGQLLLEEYYVLAMVGKAGLNTLHMDGNTRLCTATAAASMRESFGSDGQPGSYADIDYTDCLFLVGHNMAATQTVLWARVLDRLEGPDPPKLIVVDPRASDTAQKATIHVRPKLGTNVALLNGLQHLIIENGWVNEQYVVSHVCGLDELKKVVKDYTPEYVGKITGVPIAQLHETAKALALSGSLLSTALQGVYQSKHRGRMNGQPTAQNNRETGCDGEYAGFRNHQNPNHMREIAKIWNINYEQVPHWNEPTHIMNMLNYIESGSIEMLWVSGTNPLVSLPHLDRVRELLTKPELFLIVQDLFLTETAAVADVLLPAAHRKAVDPPGEAKADLDIFLDFARRMDFKDKEGRPLIPFTHPEEVFEEWKRMSSGRPLDCSDLTISVWQGATVDNGKFFTDTDYCESYGHDLETGAPLTKEQYEAMNPAGRAILKAAHYRKPWESPDEGLPFYLSTGRNGFHFHTRTKTGRSKRLQNADKDACVVVCPADADEIGVTNGEMVIVRSRRGQVELPVKIGEINKGHVFIPFHFGYWDSQDQRARAANELTIGTSRTHTTTVLLTDFIRVEQWDPVSKQPTFKSGVVRIEKCVQKENEPPVSREKQSKAI